MTVTLRPITAETVRRVTDLAVRPDQQRFVARNAESLAEALFAPEAWYRAIHRDEELVGFVMLHDESLRVPMPEKPRAFLWRFMIDQRYQSSGVGRAALTCVVEHVRAKGLFPTLQVSFVPGEGGPESFYLRYGFRPTGLIEDGEPILELPLDPPPAAKA